MNTEIQQILDALSETSIAHNVSEKHDELRAKYTLKSNRVASTQEFEQVIGDYYNYHYSAAITHGGRLSETKAVREAEKAIETAYRRQGKNVTLAYSNATKGLDGGMRRVLDCIADEIKIEDEETYMNGVFSHYVDKYSYDEKVEIIRQFMEHCHTLLGDEVDQSRPERYADDYIELIRAYLNSIRGIAQTFRKL